MDIASRFAEALDADVGAADQDPDLLPMRLARAAAAVLPVHGVGLRIHWEPGLRIPLAASRETASTAERLQFTTGSGPCLLAAESTLPVFATEEILRRWPAFHDLLLTHTPIRSVLALSLPGRLKGIGAIDLYLTDPDGAITIDIFEARCVAELVSDHLTAAAHWLGWTLGGEMPAWADTPNARRRGRLWMAVGMLMLALTVPAPDALAALRGYAYAADRTADDVALDLVERRLQPERLRQDPDNGA